MAGGSGSFWLARCILEHSCSVRSIWWWWFVSNVTLLFIVLFCSKHPFRNFVSFYILFFPEPASVFCSGTIANLSLSPLLSHGPHSAQPALRGLQAVCRGQGSGVLSKRRRVLHHWNGGRGSQTLQVSLMAFFPLLFYLYFSSDTNVSLTHWSHPVAELEVNSIHLHFIFFCVRLYVCAPLLGTYSRLKWSAYGFFFFFARATEVEDQIHRNCVVLRWSVASNKIAKNFSLSDGFCQQSWRRTDLIWMRLEFGVWATVTKSWLSDVHFGSHIPLVFKFAWYLWILQQHRVLPCLLSRDAIKQEGLASIWSFLKPVDNL